MSSEAAFHAEMISLYRRTGEATGYWPSYFLREVRSKGGLAVARGLLAPGRASAGFHQLVTARRMDLSVEDIALEPRFRHLFTDAELETARSRLEPIADSAWPKRRDPSELDENLDESVHLEGATQRRLVISYERNPKARAACLKAHGYACAACGLVLADQYGEIAEGFVHVHHKRPLGTLKQTYRVDPIKDLVPLCPNCHAIVHRRDPPLDVEQLRAILSSA